MRDIPISAIEDASHAIYQAAVRTPLVRLELPLPSATQGPEIFLKLESLQPIGSFKIRGAWNAVRQLSPEQLQRGVWTSARGMPRRAWRLRRIVPAPRAR
jgi:threonine dehydratase